MKKAKMNLRRTFVTLCMVAIVALAFGSHAVFALATASDTAADGNNCGKISIPRGVKPGILTIKTVKITKANGTVITDGHTVVAGTDNSTQPKLKFDPALDAGDIVEVTMLSKNADGGTPFQVTLDLETNPRGC